MSTEQVPASYHESLTAKRADLRSLGACFEEFIRHFSPRAVLVFIDPKSYIYLDGSTLEYQTSMMGRGFKFTNPNVKGTCGCGESVQF